MAITGRVRAYGNAALPSDTSISLQTESGQFIGRISPSPAGQFNFPNLLRANYRVIVVATGYETAESDVNVESVGDFAYVDIFLSPEPVKEGKKAAGPQVVSVAQLAPPAARKYFEKGARELKAGKLDKAKEQFTKAIKSFPCYAQAHVALAYVDQKKKDYSAAEAGLKKAIACDSNDAEAYFRLGMVLNEEGKFSASRQAISEVLGRFPAVWELHYALAIALSQLRDMTSSEQEYLKVLSLNPGAPSGVHAELSEVYLQEQRYGKAYEQMRKYLTQDPNGPVAGIMRQQMHDLESSGKLQQSSSEPAVHNPR